MRSITKNGTLVQYTITIQSAFPSESLFSVINIFPTLLKPQVEDWHHSMVVRMVCNELGHNRELGNSVLKHFGMIWVHGSTMRGPSLASGFHSFSCSILYSQPTNPTCDPYYYRLWYYYLYKNAAQSTANFWYQKFIQPHNNRWISDVNFYCRHWKITTQWLLKIEALCVEALIIVSNPVTYTVTVIS